MHNKELRHDPEIFPSKCGDVCVRGRRVFSDCPAERVGIALGYIEDLARAGTPETREIDTITLRHAEASAAARSITSFFRDRARAMGLADQEVTVSGSRDGNVLIVSADPEQMVLLRDLVARIDTTTDDGRRTEVYVLKHTTADEAAGTIKSLMDTTGEDAVRVMSQPSTNARRSESA